jgi:hypothetical protein
MKWLRLSKVPRSAAALIVSTGVIVTLATPVSAAPFGLGVFGENIPFGAVTSLSMAINGTVDLQLAPTGNSLEAADSHDVVVSSTDVVGYKLYVYALSSTNLESGSDSIPASGNVTPNTLTLNSWGYNTDGSSNFVGMMLTPREIKSASGPYTNGDTTTVTYKALVPQSTPEGSYTTTIVYTAVPGTF